MPLKPSVAAVGFGLVAVALSICLTRLVILANSPTPIVTQDFFAIIILPMATGAMQDTFSAVVEPRQNLYSIARRAMTKIVYTALCYWPLTVFIAWSSGRDVTFLVPSLLTVLQYLDIDVCSLGFRDRGLNGQEILVD
jgi:hypothetical protein